MNKLDDLQVPNLTVTGQSSFPPGTIPGTAISSGVPVPQNAVRHRKDQVFSQAKGAAVAANTGQIFYRATGDGTVLGVHAGFIQAATGDSTATIDVKKNGTTILNSTIVLDNTNAAYASEAGSVVASPTYVEGDIFEVVVAVAAGSGVPGQGLFVQLTVDEGN